MPTSDRRQTIEIEPLLRRLTAPTLTKVSPGRRGLSEQNAEIGCTAANR
jgi:hypothetical protein